MIDEKAVLDSLKSGDAQAFERLVSEHEARIFALARRYTGNPHDAADICQEVFVRVFRFIGGFSGESSLSTWIYRIAINVCRDFAAKGRKIVEIPLETEQDGENRPLEIADARFSPENALERAELREEIVKAIESLPEKYREVIILRDINDLSYEQISLVLGLENGTVKSRISRARERLRGFLLKGGNFSGRSPSKSLRGGRDYE